jgi:putative ABC transport system permease protein
MLELKDVVKEYKTADETVAALKGVSLKFRKSEFVSILGPSGCGKTTLLNIIGGLDRYTSGDLIINGKSTKDFSDKDWDTYRNHSVGFVFQSYNLIPHQTVLENVELALTLSGIGAKERRERAVAVLEKVGLGKKINVRPNQLSGGQMQRVAIARALINDPEILLADEPTGALDSKTSVQIMELLKEISSDRLIIMVTHNPELAEKYSSRIIRLFDGVIEGDDKPLTDEEVKVESAATPNDKRTNKGRKKTSMSFLTALSLSFRNLMTKKGRTFLVSFAGSIGIIGIALILSLSSGFQTYINRTQEETLSKYPITIQQTYTDMSSVLEEFNKSDNAGAYPNDGKISQNDSLYKMIHTYSGAQVTNNLEKFKKELDKKEYNTQKITAVQYTYNMTFDTYVKRENGKYERVMSTVDWMDKTMGGLQMSSSYISMYAGMMGSSGNAWSEALDNEGFIKSKYDVLAGEWMDFDGDPEVGEVMVVVDKYNRIPDYILPALGLADKNELLYDIANAIPGAAGEIYKNMYNVTEVAEEDKFAVKYKDFTAADLVGREFSIVLPAAYYYKENADDATYKYALYSDDVTVVSEQAVEQAVAAGKKAKVVGVIRQKENVSSGALSSNIVYSNALTKTLLKKVGAESVVVDQKATPELNVLTGKTFDAETAEKAGTSFDGNMLKFGYADENKPSSIAIYASSFANKDYIESFIAGYNEKVESEGNTKDKISYTDYTGMMMSSITTIINAVSYVLIGFVSVSLIVSSIMIGIITYISVLERIKEIGVLRALGASKKDVARVFNAETLIIGLAAGIIGIAVTILLNIPVSAIICSLAGIKNVAVLPWQGGLILVAISMLLTFIAGLIPSRIASKKDPVVALRSE